jgi:hypothetical protein
MRSIQYTTLFQTLPQFTFQELLNADILGKTLSSSGFEYKVSGGSLCRGRLKRAKLDVAIEWVAGDDGPAVKDEGGCGLTLGMNLTMLVTQAAM